MDAFERRRFRRLRFLGRISTDKSDPGYANLKNLWSHYSVTTFVDGVEQRFVEAADPEEGWVCRRRVSNFGNPVFTTETVKGEVEIRLMPNRIL